MRLAQLDEAIAIARIDDEDGHRDDVLERTACARDGRGEVEKRLPDLTVEIAVERFPVRIMGSAMAGDPEDAPAAGGDHGRESAVLLPGTRVVVLLHVALRSGSKFMEPSTTVLGHCMQGPRLTWQPSRFGFA